MSSDSQATLFPLASSLPSPSPPLPAPYDDPALLQEVFSSAGRRTVILISLDAVKHNISRIKSLAAPNTEVMAVVKGAAYGSGVMGVATAAVEAGAKELAVATVSEGVFLRKQGVAVPITVLGNLCAEELPDVLAHHLHPTLGWTRAFEGVDPSTLKYLDQNPLEVHVEIDTGMSRYGTQPEDLPSVMAALHKLGVKVRSLYTHFQSAITKPELNQRQYDCFVAATKPFP